MLKENLAVNIVDLASAHPDTEFYLFFPPYSVVWWDGRDRAGGIDRQVDIQAAAAEQLLQADNIRLFCFCDAFDITSDLSLYKDETHYDEDVNSMILRWMRSGEHELTKENYLGVYEGIRAHYKAYDYESIFS